MGLSDHVDAVVEDNRGPIQRQSRTVIGIDDKRVLAIGRDFQRCR